MTFDWAPLRMTMSEFRMSGNALPIWWRDDDAVAETKELERLAGIGETVGLPIHIAVIPDLIEPSLRPVFDNNAHLVPLVHGWRHQRHFLNGKKDTEFGIRRPDDEKETQQALAKMRSVFGSNLAPIFVPPWNMISESLQPVLAQQGYVGLSTFQPRSRRETVRGLVQINTHIDPIEWRGSRGLVDPTHLITQLCRHIRARMEGAEDPAEPLGFLTHHLVHTEDIWRFSEECLTELLNCGAVPTNLKEFEANLP